MNTISRRTLIGAMAALPASAGPGRARSAPEAPEHHPVPARVPATPAELARYHLEAYKVAAQAADPTIKSWWRGIPEDDDDDVAIWLVARRDR